MQNMAENENKSEQPTTPVLNGQPVTIEQLQERQKDRSVRIVETSPNVFKELRHLKETA
jgi:hypothetical protein